MIGSLGICSWCIDRQDVPRAVAVAGGEFRVRVVQIGFFGEEALAHAEPRRIAAAAAEHDVTITGVFVGFDGEDYSSIERIAATGGLAPDDCHASRKAQLRDGARIAAELGCPSITFHAGALPDDPAAPRFRKLLERVAEAAGAVAESRLRLLLETGRESSETLLAFLNELPCENVGVNFDSGNFIIYGTDDPVSSVTRLRGAIENVHLKDAVRAARPRSEYGRAVPLGTGDANVARVLSKLRAAAYRGPLLLETPAALASAADIRNALSYLRSMVA